MPAAILALTLGGILVYSALKGQTVKDVLAGVTGNTLDASGHHLTQVDDTGTSGGTVGDALQDTMSGSVTGTNWTAPTGGAHSFKGPSAALLNTLAGQAQNQYKLTITATTNGTHTPSSYHYQGRAFDAAGAETDMKAFAQMVQNNYLPKIKELIHNPGFAVKNGVVVNPIVYSAVWAGHKDHVHVAA